MESTPTVSPGVEGVVDVDQRPDAVELARDSKVHLVLVGEDQRVRLDQLHAQRADPVQRPSPLTTNGTAG